MAVTSFISRLKRAQKKNEPTFQVLGMDFGIGSLQEPLIGRNITSDATASRFTGVGNRYLESPELALNYLKSIYKPLKRHYDWFRRSQRGQIKQYSRVARSRTEAYRWRGRSEAHVLTSGMDDYPRGPPHAGELHLDLISWMGFFTRTMREIAEFVGEKEDENSFREIENSILNNIEGSSLCFWTWCLN
jgi:mannosyl-oligosaccharide glucosidase